MMKQVLVLIFIGLLHAACGSVKVTTVKKDNAKPTNCKLDVFYQIDEIKRKYEVLCIINSETGQSLFDDKSLIGAINKAKPQACSCGADAVVVDNSQEKGIGLMSWGKTIATIKAIKYIN